MAPPFADLRMVTGVQEDTGPAPRPATRRSGRSVETVRSTTLASGSRSRPACAGHPRTRCGSACCSSRRSSRGSRCSRGSSARHPDAVLLSVAAVSPAALFAVERGNVDLFVFFVVCIAIRAVQAAVAAGGGARGGGRAQAVSGVRSRGARSPQRRRRSRLPRIVGLACMVLYVFVIRGELSSVRRGTMASRLYSYGVANLSNVIASALRLPVPLPACRRRRSCGRNDDGRSCGWRRGPQARAQTNRIVMIPTTRKRKPV